MRLRPFEGGYMNKNFEYMDVALPEDVLRSKLNGDFELERQLIERYLKSGVASALKCRLAAEEHIIDFLAAAYPLTAQQALKTLQQHNAAITDADFQQLKIDGCLDWCYIGGEPHFRRNIYNTLRAAGNKFAKPDEDDEKSRALLDSLAHDMKENGAAGYRFKVRYALKVTADLPDNELLRVHLPLARVGDGIDNVEITAHSDQFVSAAAEDAAQRTAYFECSAKDSREFFVEFTFENISQYKELDEELAEVGNYNTFVDPQPPHIPDSHLIRSLAQEIVRDETNPLRQARRIYDYVTDKVIYSFMRPYFTVDCLSEFAAANLKGDCGVQALLFIALCRSVGIPARWRSGSYIESGDVGMHDWAQFFVSPFGWLWSDCSFGGSAHRAGSEERRDFYFGNLDPLRMIANSEFAAEFTPPKCHWRWDPYDNQCGECECGSRALLSGDYEEEQTVLECERIV